MNRATNPGGSILSAPNMLRVAIAAGLIVSTAPAEGAIIQNDFIGFSSANSYAVISNQAPNRQTVTSGPPFLAEASTSAGVPAYAYGTASADLVSGDIKLLAVSDSSTTNVTVAGGVMDEIQLGDPTPQTTCQRIFDASCFDDSGFRLNVSLSGSYSGGGGASWAVVARLSPTDTTSYGLGIDSQTGTLTQQPNGSVSFVLPVGTYYLDIGGSASVYGVGVADMSHSMSFAITGPDGSQFGSASGAFPVIQPVPEPTTVTLVGMGLAAMGIANRRQRR